MGLMLRCCRILAVAALFVAACGSVVRGSGEDDGAVFALQPVRYDPAVPATRSYFVLESQPGSSVASEVRVTNAGKALGTVRLYPVDATTGATSGTVFRAEGDPRLDAGGWIALGAASLTLAPGESRIVPFTVAVPAAQRPGQHVGGIVAENAALQADQGTGGVQVNIRHRNIIAVQVDLPGPVVEQLEVTGAVPGGAQGAQTLLLGLRNEGTVMLKPTGTLTIRDATGMVVQRIPLALDTMLPLTAIDYPARMQDRALDVGEYEATVELTYGEQGAVRSTIRFAINQQQVQQVFKGSQTVAPPASVAATSPPDAMTAAAAPAGGDASRRGSGTSLPLLGLGGALCGMLLMAVIGSGVLRARRRRG
jgi:hypothetical protein